MIEFISKRTLSYNKTETKKKKIDFPTRLLKLSTSSLYVYLKLWSFLLRSHEIVCELKVP